MLTDSQLHAALKIEREKLKRAERSPNLDYAIHYRNRVCRLLRENKRTNTSGLLPVFGVMR